MKDTIDQYYTMANSKCEGGQIQPCDTKGNSSKTTTKNTENVRVKVQWPKSCSKVFPSCRAMNESPTQVAIDKREVITGLNQEKENARQNQNEKAPSINYKKEIEKLDRNDQELNEKYEKQNYSEDKEQCEKMRKTNDHLNETNLYKGADQCDQNNSCYDGKFSEKHLCAHDRIKETNSTCDDQRITERNSCKDKDSSTKTESCGDINKCNKSCKQMNDNENYSEEDTATIARLRAQRRWRMGLLKRAKFGGFGDTDVSDLFPDYFPSPFTITQGNEDDDILTSLKESKQRHRAKLLKQNSIDKIDRELGDRETKLIAGSWLQIYS